LSLIFEWDENKANENLKKDGVSFDEAKTVFNDPFSVTIYDPDYSIDEDRYIGIGLSSKGRLSVVSYLERGTKKYALSVAGRQQRRSKGIMKKNEKSNEVNEMRNEYDFSGGVRGKHFKAYRQGHTVKINKQDGSVEVHYFTQEEGAVMLDPDVKKHFPDSESVNKALRSLVTTH